MVKRLRRVGDNVKLYMLTNDFNSQADDCADLQIGGVFRYFRYEEAS